jgi:hypothetical protein
VGCFGKGETGWLKNYLLPEDSARDFWMLTEYPKSVTETIPAHILRQILKEMEDVGK